MTVGEILYKLLIGPLELLFEVIFVVANRKVSNPALAIIALSLAMNLLVLPLYRRADAIQAEEKEREEKMRPWIDHIKKTFKGDERFMILQTYYRQNDYKPTQVFRGSISLLLEIPFFIAAYRFLSNLEILQGVSFGPISNLGLPDGMLNVGGVSVNLLPILMTLINFISASIYLKGASTRNKIQTYGIAIIFLVLLYGSPAGLVFYWTLNNIFSLVKNIFYKIKNPQKIIEVGLSVMGGALLLVVLFVHPMRSLTTQLIVILALLMLQLPTVLHLLRSHGISLKMPETTAQSNTLFYASCILLTILTGLLCPSAVISDSAEEFIDITHYYSPNWYIVSALLLATGTFMIWFRIFYSLASDAGKQYISLFVSMAAIVGLVNYMFFGRDYGTISPDLEFEETLSITAKSILLNSAVVLVIAGLVFVLWRKKYDLLKNIVIVSVISLAIMGTVNVFTINKVLADDRDLIESAVSEEPALQFSKNGKNIVVVMMDRMAGFYIPYILNEKPELKEEFDGFTYFSNVTSNATTTNEGAPCIYGGYDYIPAAINARDSEPIADKHDEALRLMPTMLGDSGYNVTLCDPTYAGYKQIPDIAVFKDHPEWNVYNINGRYSAEEYGYSSSIETSINARLRNFFCYSLFKISPTIAQRTLYERGGYNSAESAAKSTGQITEGPSIAHGLRQSFMRQYSTLCNLSKITEVSDNEDKNFTMMTNDTTHAAVILQEPAYIPALEIDNTEYDKEHKTRIDEEGNVLSFENMFHRKHYHINMAAMLKFGEWFEYLKSEGVYDNTRIIIVSDHGTPFRWESDNCVYYNDEDTGEKKHLDIRRFGCALLYKDFNAKDFTVSDQFTTNADVPALAMEGEVEKLENPFTGNPIIKFDESMLPWDVARTSDYDIATNNGNVFKRSNWFELNGRVNDVNSWKYIGNR